MINVLTPRTAVLRTLVTLDKVAEEGNSSNPPAPKRGEVRSGNGTAQIRPRPLGSVIQAVLAELSPFQAQCFWCWVKARKAWGYSSAEFPKKKTHRGARVLGKEAQA